MAAPGGVCHKEGSGTQAEEIRSMKGEDQRQRWWDHQLQEEGEDQRQRWWDHQLQEEEED